jgi:formate--tetrahydrofolate ligase
MLPIVEVARCVGLGEDDLECYGEYKAKVHLSVRDRLRQRPNGKYVAVTGITPTPLGEGKTVTTLGLAQSLHVLQGPAFACIRQPSMGPTFGVKGGAAGGGEARVLPADDVNLHLTGDTHAVSAAQNLLAAAVDAHLFHGNELGIDPRSIGVNRVVDVNDRALRHVIVGLGGTKDSLPRETGYDLTPASEAMAILALATDLADLRQRLGRMVVGFTATGAAVTADDLHVSGAMAVLLKDALLPNLLQSAAGSPVLVHTGSFGNIGIGNSSVIADLMAAKLADYVVTECGFGADMGLEKLMHLKAPISGMTPDCIVLVATVRALKMHGGAGRAVAGRALPPGLSEANLPALERGCANLVRQIANAQRYGAPVVVAINKFPGDSPPEVALVRRESVAAGAVAACPSAVYEQGVAGGAELAEAVAAACRHKAGGPCREASPEPTAVKEQIEVIAREIYGADCVDYQPAAERSIARLTALGWGRLPVCMVKTPLSLSHDPGLLGAPTGFRLPVRDVRPWIGAGLIHVLCGDIQTMPGLPSRPGFRDIDLADGRIVGLA